MLEWELGWVGGGGKLREWWLGWLTSSRRRVWIDAEKRRLMQGRERLRIVETCRRRVGELMLKLRWKWRLRKDR